jgi:hypothetical protein
VGILVFVNYFPRSLIVLLTIVRYWSTAATSEMTHQSGASQNVRQEFLDYGELPDTRDFNYRAINDEYPVFAFGE